jgi:hypothetical protein
LPPAKAPSYLIYRFGHESRFVLKSSAIKRKRGFGYNRWFCGFLAEIPQAHRQNAIFSNRGFWLLQLVLQQLTEKEISSGTFARPQGQTLPP